MGIFTRFRDIINSNINSMLERAEDPEKLLRLMIQEMEETLVELKASCAAAMAVTMKIRRDLEHSEAKALAWHDKAGLAVTKGFEELAREALLEKRRLNAKTDQLSRELDENQALIEGYKADIATLEEKLQGAKDKQRLLVQRHRRAMGKKRAGQDLRRADAHEALMRFEEFEQRIERMEAEAELAGPWSAEQDHGQRDASRQSFTLEEKFAMLEADEDIERELEALRGGTVRQDVAPPEQDNKEQIA